MRLIGTGRKYSASLNARDERILDLICRSLAGVTALEPLGRYRRMTQPQDLWWPLVGQVCVMGSARFWDLAKEDLELQQRLAYKQVIAARSPLVHLRSVLKTSQAARFPVKSAQMLLALLRNDNVFEGSRLRLFDDLNHRLPTDEIRDTLMSRVPQFKLKSASDFMVTVGLSQDVMALDTRVMGLLGKKLDLDVTASTAQTNPYVYRAIEGALRLYCQERGMKLSLLDRMLFQFSARSAIDLVLGNPRYQFCLA